MGVAAPKRQNRIARGGLGEAALDGDNMYATWYRRFILLFGLLCLIVIGAAWFNSDLSQTSQVVITVTTLALMAWFWFVGQWHIVRSDLHAVIYLLGNLVGVAILIQAWDGTALLLFSAYWFGFAYLISQFAIVYAFLLTVGSQWAFGTIGSGIGPNIETFVSAVLLIILLGFSWMMARYIESFQSEAELNRHLLSELKSAQAELIEREREQGIEQERRRMAGEIHDTIAQHFASIITNLRAANELVEKDPVIGKQHVAHAFSAAQQGLSDSRAMLSTMQPDVLLGRSLADVLQSIVTEWDASADPVGGFVMIGSPSQLTRVQESILVRALQESLRNVAKHASASKVDVSLTWLEDEVLLDISDDGVGFTPQHVDAGANGYRMGLTTMESRVESAGGTFALESNPGEGTSIAIAFPTGDES